MLHSLNLLYSDLHNRKNFCCISLLSYRIFKLVLLNSSIVILEVFVNLFCKFIKDEFRFVISLNYSLYMKLWYCSSSAFLHTVWTMSFFVVSYNSVSVLRVLMKMTLVRPIHQLQLLFRSIKHFCTEDLPFLCLIIRYPRLLTCMTLVIASILHMMLQS